MKSSLKYAIVVAATALSGPAMAETLNPDSYSFDQSTSNGTFGYSDPSLSKLTDGVTGNAGWGHSGGVEWVGWNGKPTVNIDFLFESFVQVASITFYTAQNSLGDVTFPSLQVFSSTDGIDWVLQKTLTVPADSANNTDYMDGGPAPSLVVDGLNFVSQYVRVAALANGPWTFASEVTFEGSSVAVPGPEAGAGLGALALGSIALWAARRRRISDGLAG